MATSNTAPNASSNVTTEKFFVFKEHIIEHASAGKDIAQKFDDKMWRCLCNALMCAATGPDKREFCFNANPVKNEEALKNALQKYPEREEWLSGAKAIISTAMQRNTVAEMADPNFPGFTPGEMLAIKLIEELVVSFESENFKSFMPDIQFSLADAYLSKCLVEKRA